MADKVSLKNIVGEELLNKVQDCYLKYLGSSVRIYEVNGNCAATLFSSKYCGFLNHASRKMAGKTDEEALKSGKWICHEDCWATSLESIKNKKPCEMEYSCGIKIYAAPIIAKGLVIGSNNAGVSNPPTDEKKINEIAQKYKVNPKELLEIAKEHTPRPEYLLNAAKNHILVVADAIAEIFLRKRAEEGTMVAKSHADNIIKSMIDILIVVDPDAKIKTINKAALDALEYTEDELIGKPVATIFAAEEPFKETKLEKVIKDGQLTNYEIMYKAKDGRKIPVLLSSTVMKTIDCPYKGPIKDCPVYKEKGKHCEKILGIVCVAKNITERKKTEQELKDAYQKLKETQEQLIQSGKMATMGQIAAGISHELVQPLTGIKGFAQAVLMNLDKKSPVRGDLKKVVAQADRMDTIIKNVRSFARKSDFKMQELDINQPIEDSLMLLRQQLKVRNIQLKIFPGENLPRVKGDPNQLEQVFLNLIANARDALDQSKSRKRRELVVRTSLSKDKNNVETIFQDTGCGISKENMKNIFNPFFTTKSSSRGIGLGLSITYRIIENHKGRIEVFSEEGNGTTFKIILPMFTPKKDG